MGNYPRLLKGIQKTFKISEMTQGNINKYFDTDIYPKRKRLAEDVWAWAKAQQTREEIERIKKGKIKKKSAPHQLNSRRKEIDKCSLYFRFLIFILIRSGRFDV